MVAVKCFRAGGLEDPRPGNGSTGERGLVSQVGRAHQGQERMDGRMDLRSAGTRKTAFREGGDTGTHLNAGEGGQSAGVREAAARWGDGVLTLGSKSLIKCVKPGSGIWKTASGELSEEQGSWQGKTVTQESLAWGAGGGSKRKG